MKIDEIEIGMRVRHNDPIAYGCDQADNPADPIGTVIRVHHRPPEWDEYGVTRVFAVEVSWDGIDYTQHYYHPVPGIDIYDMINPGEIKPA